MARSDLLLNIVRAGSRGDEVLFRRSVEALIAEERAKNHHVLADRLAEYLNANGRTTRSPSIVVDERNQGFALEIVPQRSLDDLVLPPPVRRACDELVEEHRRSELLRSYNLEPRHRILLIGPPGNGKTSLAEALAEALALPLFFVRYEAIIGSFLGETAARLSRMFDYIRTRRCVLFFDEFDALGKERGDIHETGEIKRVVSTLLLQIDAIPSHVVIITATNHPELLDRAAWRRFQLRLFLPKPDKPQIKEWMCRFQTRFDHPLGYDLRMFADRLHGLSFAEIEQFATDIQRRYVLSLPSANIKRIVKERFEQLETAFRPISSDSEPGS